MIRVAWFLAWVLALTGLTAVPAAVAGAPSDYPEYPYAATDYTEPDRKSVV